MYEMILRECGDDNILTSADSIKTAETTPPDIINDILYFLIIEAGKLIILSVDCDHSSVLNNSANMVQVRADIKGLVRPLVLT